ANYKPFENLWHFRDKIYKSRQYKWVILSTEIDYSNQILSSDLMKPFINTKNLWNNYKPILALNQFDSATIFFERK
ncbi:MAG: hypothetical protein LBB10_01105, partial [Bifidobacteriaceae bacterium]|nr:hypothetical protein [Bifidobacteriaceae bacterium]